MSLGRWGYATTRQNGGVIWLVLGLMAYLLAVSVVALLPIRRIPALEMISWVVGWLTGELVVATLLIEALTLGFMWRWGWPSDWRSDVLMVLATLVAATQVVLLSAMWRAPRAVRRGLETSGPFPLSTQGFRPLRFNRWWRSVVVLPLRSRDISVVRDIAYGPHRQQRLDVLRHSLTPSGAPVLFYVHGGAWVFGDKREQARPMMFEFVRQGWVVVSVNYRLAPFHKWPSHVEDVVSALAWVKRHIAIHGGDASRIVVSGGSAGGQLSALVALTANSNDFRPSTVPEHLDLSVRGAIPFYGVHDMTGDADIWRGTGDGLVTLLETAVMNRPFLDNADSYFAASPMRRVAPDAPPFLVVQGRNDSLVDRNVAARFAEVVRTMAPTWLVELPLAQHAFDISHSPRTTASTRAAVSFATWCVAQPESDYPSVPEELALAYQVPPTQLLVVTLDGPKVATEVAAERGSFYVITPCNPFSHHAGDVALNDALLAVMDLDVASLQCDALPTVAFEAATGEYEERGFALWNITHHQAQRWARRFHQFAFYYVTPQGVTVIAAKDGKVLTPTPA